MQPALKYAIDAVSGRTAGRVVSTLTKGGFLLVYGGLSGPGKCESDFNSFLHCTDKESFIRVGDSGDRLR